MTQSLILSVFSVFLMMVPGYVLGRRGILSDRFLKDLTRLIVQFIFPCLAFTSVLKNFSLEVLMQNWQLPFSSIIITFAGYLTARVFQLFYKIKNAKTNSSSEKMLFEWIKNNEISFSEFQILLKIKEWENELN